jgi:hypothetical protein
MFCSNLRKPESVDFPRLHNSAPLSFSLTYMSRL